MSTQTAIGITGVGATVRAIREFEPEIKTRMDRTIRTALNKTRDGARARYPHGDWVVRVNRKNLLGAIAARGGGGRAERWGESAPGTRAAIFEFAGSRTSGSTPQVRGLIDSLNRRYGSPGRFLWDAWEATGERALETIRGAVLQAEAELQAKLDAAGEAY